MKPLPVTSPLLARRAKARVSGLSGSSCGMPAIVGSSVAVSGTIVGSGGRGVSVGGAAVTLLSIGVTGSGVTGAGDSCLARR